MLGYTFVDVITLNRRVTSCYILTMTASLVLIHSYVLGFCASPVCVVLSFVGFDFLLVCLVLSNNAAHIATCHRLWIHYHLLYRNMIF